MIKPEDLRIGDLVRVCCDCEFPEGTLRTVSEIRILNVSERTMGVVKLIPTNGNDDEWQEVWCGNIEGIPLTPEILEKNGWYFDADFVLSCIRDDHCFEVKFPPGSGWKYAVMGSETLRRFKYVHELQHILWALGYNAELKI